MVLMSSKTFDHGLFRVDRSLLRSQIARKVPAHLIRAQLRNLESCHGIFICTLVVGPFGDHSD